MPQETGLAGAFTLLDWGVILGILVATTIVGERLAGKQHTIRDFFLGGRKLPWYAVAASIVATEISAVTYVSLPSVVFKPGGNLTYLQLGLIGSLLARWIVGLVLVPAYYEREIYSPYDYVGERLGESARRATTVLFSLGGVLAQSSRVYLTAIVLEVVLHPQLAALESATGVPPIAAAVIAIGLVAVLWTWMGGIATVIWTDAILFVLFLVGITATLLAVQFDVAGGLSAAFSDAAGEGKFRLLDFDTDPTKVYTFWVALIGVTWWNVGSFGTDQLMAQRIFCCKDARAARRAIVASYGGMIVTVLVSFVGIGLWAYAREHPFSSAGAALIAENADRVFPVFIVEVLPVGVKGLVLAGAFAAAISSLDSILAALAQTTLSAVVLPLRARKEVRDEDASAKRDVRISRALVLGWAVVLCAAAIGMESVAARYDSILDLALGMATYTAGALLAAFLLAFLRAPVDGRGMPWACALSVGTVYATQWHTPQAQRVCWILGGLVVVTWVLAALRDRQEPRSAAFLTRLLALVAGGIGLFLVSRYGVFVPEAGAPRNLAYPWCVPLGTLVAYAYARLLGHRRAARS